MTQPKPPQPSKGRFPGLDAIRERAKRPPEEKKRPGRPRKNWTAEELARLSPSDRRRVERRTVAVRKGDNTVERAELPPRSGRVSLTPELIETISLNIASCAPLKDCAQAAGISRETLDEWLRRADDPKEPDPIYRALAESVVRARSTAVVGMAATARSGRKGWQGAAWLLERRHSEDFGPPMKKLEHSGTGIGGAIRITGSVELPAEIPDGHPSLSASSNGVSSLNGHSNGAGHREASLPILSSGVRLPDEEDPD